MKLRPRPAVFFAVCVICVLFLFAVLNARIAIDTVKKSIANELTFKETVEEIQSRYISDEAFGKDWFVDLNGLFARLTGKRVHNYIVRGKEGFLLAELTSPNPEPLASSVIQFSEYLEEHEEIPFLYVQAPCKEDFGDELFPYGTSSYGNEAADAMLSLLESNDVDTLDLRPDLSATPELLAKSFYRTDHHWSADGAFSAFQIILEELEERFPDRGIDLSYAQNDQWERHTLENWFLGSHGKRVGQYYGGTDDLVWYTPRFETNMSCIIMKYRLINKGDFSDANIRSEYLESKDYHGDNPYCVYIGGDYPLVQHRNLLAPSDLKILWLKDSFTLPLQAFLSTAFQEIDVVDPRHFKECSIAEYASRNDYDIVIMCVNPSVLGVENYADLGVDEASQSNSVFLSVWQGDVTIEPMQHAYNHYPLEVESGKTYRFSFDDVFFTAGSSLGIEVKLYSVQTKKTLHSYLFDAEYCSESGGSEWVFTVPDVGTDKVQLVIYAGVSAETEGNGVVFKNAKLEECKELIEDDEGRPIVYQGNIELGPNDHPYHNYAVDVSGGAVYHLSFSEVVFKEGLPTGVHVMLYDRTAKSALKLFFFEAGDAGCDIFFEVPDTGSDEIQLLFYSGTRGAAQGNLVIYRDVCLNKMGILSD